MSFREITMVDVREVLRRMQAGQSARRVARDGVVDRKTASRYFEAARSCGVEPDTVLDDGLVAEVARRVQARPQTPPSEAWTVLEREKPRIEAWLSGERPLRLVRIHELLARDGIDVGYSTLRRFAHAQLGWRERAVTVRVDDPPFGEEAQVDFGHVGFLDVDGKRRKLWALVVTLSASRYMFVWPLLVQTTEAFCEGLDAAWRFFDGMPQRLVLDNTTAAIIKPDPLTPGLQRSFQEYAQARGLFVDPARVRRPQDKPRVENQIAYVRERCFDGEKLLCVDDARAHAEHWSRDVAGARVHGTTRAVPRDVYERDEKPRMRPRPDAAFDVPTWTSAKVHPDHHVQVARALYSAPTAYVGRHLDVRIDRTSVRLYAGAELVKVHLRVAPGKRSTDPNDYPEGKSDYALRSFDRIVAQARARGAHVGQFAERLLAGPMPWRHMRAAYALLRLCDRYGAERIDALCARAIAFDVLDVRRIEGMARTAQKLEDDGAVRGQVVQLPLTARFARDARSFATRSDKGGER